MTAMGAAPARKPRDPRLDFFRGAAMFIIFIAHTEGTWLWHWIPARFGLSDAAHLFVFCSGYAAAIAFGGTFLRDGFLAGAARILLRCVQLYAAHLGLFLALLALAAAGAAPRSTGLGVDLFLAAPQDRLLPLLGFAWVPQYLDILPLYIVVLAMVPAAMLLARLHPGLVIAASTALYAGTWLGDWNFIGDPFSGRRWYFDPFAWQLVFFTGFALSRRWIEPPARSARLIAAAAAFALLSLLITRPTLCEALPPLAALRDLVQAHSDKTRLDLLAYLHFLATAYLAVVLLHGREHLLLRAVTRPIFKCGQQALSVFISGVFLSQVASLAFERFGTGVAAQLLVNGAGLAALVAVAYTVAWFKAPPWKAPRGAAHAAAAPAVTGPIPAPAE
jgi:hypothetical protein